ncbi:prolyl oligopeptidase family serine peptidase [Niabella sp. CC-SYL272]|uniref:prolyl oligopeptidase family serine peptidase n=1 Tax=Niabella agricola TaxID=2891571 RepID=UPI001F35EE87|nr:prolyl oligopeptidase family serine peptidase [Niabella agricola]MCF3110266.1 prolyl oligopeptidase family serine peptidase [Niabella agricola]
MKKIIFSIACFLLNFSLSAQYHYPASKTVDSSDTYWDVTVKDPYRWIENIKDSTVLNWFKAQADYTNAQLARIPGQDLLKNEFKAIDKIRAAAISPVAKAGGKYFYRKRLPGEQVAKLYYREGEKGKEVLLFDPQQYVAGKTFDYEPGVSDNGSRIAMNLSEAGSELGDLRILDVATQQFLADVIPHASGGFAGGSNTDILYGQYKSYDTHDPENNLNLPNKLHVVGAPVATDILLASAAKYPELKFDAADYPNVSVFKNAPWMILGKYTVENNLTLFYAPLSELKKERINWKPLTTKADEVRQFFVKGNDLYLLTVKGNPRFKIIKTSFTAPDLDNATTIAEGDETWKISSVSQVKDYLLINFSKNELVLHPKVYAFASGNLQEAGVPLKGNILLGALSEDDNEALVINTGWSTPHNFYTYQVAGKKLGNGPFHLTYNGAYPHQSDIAYEEVEVPSHDGVPVPLSIVYNKTLLKKNGTNGSLLLGYGAYGINAYLPAFPANYLPLINRGFVLAFAHIRGGGEKGNDWYLAGKKTTKPNTWKDFNACADWLVKQQYTSSERLACTGGSAGGILIGRAITERPGLYKVAIPKVGCLNTLRLEFSPNGPVNIPEFGTVKDSAEFKALLEMDAYQHTQKGVRYPAQLITTGFNDPRVESYIPAKFAANMQASNASAHPVLLYVDYKAGHFGGSTLDEQFTQRAREFGFILWQCGISGFQPEN